uniref:Uncharacterized protein n=1 Tax=Populus davidiana TaxID=266767 RepID=A0A6M2F628_9ROSI
MNTFDSFLNNIIPLPDCLCNIINCFPDALKLSLPFRFLLSTCCGLAAFFITMLMVYTDGICYIANNLSHSHSSPSTPSIPPVLFITVFPIFFSSPSIYNNWDYYCCCCCCWSLIEVS